MWQIITNDPIRKFLAVKTGVVKMILYTTKRNKRSHVSEVLALELHTSVTCFLYDAPYQVHITPSHMIQFYRAKHGQKKIQIPYIIYRYIHEVSFSDSLHCQDFSIPFVVLQVTSLTAAVSNKLSMV